MSTSDKIDYCGWCGTPIAKLIQGLNYCQPCATKNTLPPGTKCGRCDKPAHNLRHPGLMPGNFCTPCARKEYRG